MATQGNVGLEPHTKCSPEVGEGVLPQKLAVILDAAFLCINVPEIIECSNIYRVGTESAGVKGPEGQDIVPFVRTVKLHGPKGKVVRIKALFDDGAMVNVIDEGMYNLLKARLGSLVPSTRRLKMANGELVPSKGRWEGPVDIGGRTEVGAFEVFPSAGNWSLLFGKPLLVWFGAVHHYNPDALDLGRVIQHPL